MDHHHLFRHVFITYIRRERGDFSKFCNDFQVPKSSLWYYIYAGSRNQRVANSIAKWIYQQLIHLVIILNVFIQYILQYILEMLRLVILFVNSLR